MGEETEDQAEIVPEFTIINGREAFREALQNILAEARTTIHILSYDLDREIYGSPRTVSLVRDFALQHQRAQVRILINQPKRTMLSSNRLVEFGRALSSRIQFRALPRDRLAQTEDCVIGDGRTMLLRARPDDHEARIYHQPGTARLRDQRFEAIWEHSAPARELQQLRM